MRYTINLRQFTKRAQITFGAFAKGNLLPSGVYFKKQKSCLFNDIQVFFLEGLVQFELQCLLTNKYFKYE